MKTQHALPFGSLAKSVKGEASPCLLMLPARVFGCRVRPLPFTVRLPHHCQGLLSGPRSHPDLIVLRPLRDVDAKEIALCNQYENLKSVHIPNLTTAMPVKSSIDRLTEGRGRFPLLKITSN